MESQEHTEILQIASLVLLINTLRTEAMLQLTIFDQGVTLVTFDNHSNTVGHEAIYSWSYQIAYLPKLRKVRHDLEQTRDDLLAQRRERVA